MEVPVEPLLGGRLSEKPRVDLSTTGVLVMLVECLLKLRFVKQEVAALLMLTMPPTLECVNA